MADTVLDRIHIRDLGLRCIIGINPEERCEKQDVILNITMYADLRTPGKTDAIADTIDYKTVKKAILGEVETSTYFLIEKLAQRVADICLDHGVERVEVCIDKPGALRFARSVAICITRSRDER